MVAMLWACRSLVPLSQGSWDVWSGATVRPLQAELWMCISPPELLTHLCHIISQTPFPCWLSTSASITHLKQERIKKHCLSSAPTPSSGLSCPNHAKGSLRC